MMDDFCAPQWVDLTRSPQILSDNYFEVEHEVHKPVHQMHLNIIKTNLPESCKEESKNEDSVTDVKFDDSLEPKTPTCTSIAYFVPHDNKKHPIQETEKENQLNKAMNDLKLDEKCNKIHQSWNISVTDLTSAFKVSTTERKGKITIPEKPRKNIHMSGIKNTIVGKQSNTHRQKQCSLGKSQPKVLTCQYRRKSLIKDHKSNQFVSLSEMISKFQNGTPQRFRTISNKDMKSGLLMKLKRSPLKLTYPISPALRCKQRTRQTILSQQEREKLELEEMKKHQVKANPVPVNILKGPSVLKKVAKKPATITEEFRLTQPKKTRHTTDSQNSQPNSSDSKDKQVMPITRSVSASNVVKKEHASTESVVGNIKSMNCSFEARNKEFQIKKEKKLKNLHIQETNKVTIEFRARPAPKFSKPTNIIKEQNTQKRVVVPCPFSFEERNKFLAKKKEELVKQIREMNKENRVFHANPVPSFKNTAVHSLSKENLRRNGKVYGSKELGNKKTNMSSNQENKQLNIMNNSEIILMDKKKVKTKQNTVNSKSDKKQIKTNVNLVNTNYEKLNTQKKVNFELNTKKQTKERNEYNDKMRKDEHELEVKRVEEEKKRLLQQKLERTELRKTTVLKARPMPMYKPLIIVKSTKPPTSPRSPALGLRAKTKNIS